ncbi:MAG: hypothetical protein V4586_21210 [Pseudomonadota bacterium]
MRCVWAMLLAVMGAGAEARPGPALCEGKYTAAAEMVDLSVGWFGTLYSGDYASGIGRDVGATLDLYRLWHGLPDYGFRDGADLYKPAWMKHQPPGGPFVGHYYSHRYEPGFGPEWADFALNHALPYALAPNETYLSAGPRDWVASTLDVLTVPGPSPDWWFNPDRAAELSDTEVVVAWHAQRSDLVDWLLGTTVQSAYPIFAADQIQDQRWRRQPNEFGWQSMLRFDGFGQRYWAKYLASGRMEWAVLAMLFPLTTEQNVAADKLFAHWTDGVRDCSASPAEYAAFATVHYDRSARNVWAKNAPEPVDLIKLFPERMRNAMIARAARGILARQTADQSWPSGWRTDDAVRQDLAALAQVQRGERWGNYLLSSIRLLFVETVEDVANLIALNLNIQNSRLIDLLSAANLRVLAADQRLPLDKRSDLARVAFLRLFALGRIPEAESALQDYLVLRPTVRFAVESAMAKAVEPEVKLALAALTMPELSVRVSVYSRGFGPDYPNFTAYFNRNEIFSADLPDWLRTGGGLQVDVERWLQVGQFWFAQKGYTQSGMWRLHDRRMEIALPEPRFVGFPPQGPNDPGVPFGRLVALDELGRLGPDTGLSQRLSEVVIAWVEAGSDTLPELILQQNGAMPQALRQIVQLNRYRTRGDVGGVFAGKAAFRLLHDRFPLSAAARATPYWYKCASAYCDR